jgi:hypothetical protein
MLRHDIDCAEFVRRGVAVPSARVFASRAFVLE